MLATTAAEMAHTSQSPLAHVPVLRDETLGLLAPALGPGKVAVDCTAGRGGHTEALLGTGARVVAIDRDPAALDDIRRRLGNPGALELVHADFRDTAEVVATTVGGPVDALLADLGVSSPQLDDPARGFSFREGGPLDMRMDPTRGEPLSAHLARVDAQELARVIFEYGEERRSRQIARAILAARDEGELTDTARLAEVVARSAGYPQGRIHPATRTFQGLRIWVNDELGALDALLASLPDVLGTGSRAAIISFHSLEDRRVKRAFTELSRGCICPPDLPVCRCGREPRFELLTRKAITASDEETARNPRARSARLRGVCKREVAHA